MEEAVTRKFVHEDSSHIISFCGESPLLACTGGFGAVSLLGTHPSSRAGAMGSARGWIVLAEVTIPEVFVLKIYRDV